MGLDDARREDMWFYVPAFLTWTISLAVTAWDLVKLQGGVIMLSPATVIGVILFAAGLPIRLLGYRTLRESYSWTLEIREGHRLVKHGVYRYLRHPIYTGTLLGAYAVPVFCSSLYGFLVLSPAISLLLYRINVEERMLTQRYGEEYTEYMKETWKLIPYIH
ncbi:MAG: isoprenylcysteine carboxylmethyltransferase family protein [Candidatus Bathyarchaeota archaeon]|nr:isoprenylcysteine carboxylmethyltransferase family protein [Candidatus Bathyarchaeota archaeon]